MHNLGAAGALDEIADCLELKGENSFKIRAYRQVAERLRNLDVDVATLVAERQLGAIDGVGSGLAAKITEYVDTGKIDLLERLRVEIPTSLREVTSVPGVGPKLAWRLYQELGVSSLDDLREAVRQQRLQTLRGLGPKTEANIAAGLQQMQSWRGRRPIFEVLPLADELSRGLASLASVIDVAVAGSLRRRQDMVGDVDIVVASQDPAAVAQHLTHLTIIQRVLAQGDTRVSVLLHGGLQVDVRIMRPEAFASALHHFTGSKEHHVELRGLARELGLSISEYGLLEASTGERAEPASEVELYSLLGLPYIPPELREGKGVIARARRGLPSLLTEDKLCGDLHVHSDWSDGQASLAAIAAEAGRRGLEYVAVSDHSRSLTIAGGLTPEQLNERQREIAAVNEKGVGAFLLSGVEVDILADGSLDLPDEVLSRLDVVIASLHSGLRQSKERIMSRLRMAMESPHVDVIGHPTGRVLGRRAATDVDIDRLIELARATGTALEINASPHRLDLRDEDARLAGEAGVMLSVNSDAHSLEEFDHLTFGVAVARRAWLEAGSVINCWPLARLRQWLDRRC